MSAEFLVHPILFLRATHYNLQRLQERRHTTIGCGGGASASLNLCGGYAVVPFNGYRETIISPNNKL
jgi:hypothetical protein